VSAYRFCRTDDIALLVDAHNRCWLPHSPGEPPLTVAELKRWIRELQLWCSSSMVAFAGEEPIGVLLGGKRATETLIHRIAVHPEHARRGHGRHLLASLSSKLHILGPPRIVAEVPADARDACAFFERCGYARDAVLTSHVLPSGGRSPGRSGVPPEDSFLVPLTVDDLAANDLLEGGPPRCWERGVETLSALKGTIEGLGLATVDRIAAYVLYHPDERAGAEIMALRAVDEEEVEGNLGCLVDALARRRRGPIRFGKVGSEEVPPPWLEAWGFEPRETFLRFSRLATPT